MILGKELDKILLSTNQMMNHLVQHCLKSGDEERGYARCMMRKMEAIGQREDELSQKMVFVRARF